MGGKLGSFSPRIGTRKRRKNRAGVITARRGLFSRQGNTRKGIEKVEIGKRSTIVYLGKKKKFFFFKYERLMSRRECGMKGLEC